MSPKQQRLARLYQGKCRGDRRSYKTELENVHLLLAWEAGDLSEGQVASMLGVDRVSLRMMRDGAKAAGLALAAELLDEKAPQHQKMDTDTPVYAWQSVGGSIWSHKTSEEDVPLYSREALAGAQAEIERLREHAVILAATAEQVERERCMREIGLLQWMPRVPGRWNESDVAYAEGFNKAKAEALLALMRHTGWHPPAAPKGVA